MTRTSQMCEDLRKEEKQGQSSRVRNDLGVFKEQKGDQGGWSVVRKQGVGSCWDWRPRRTWALGFLGEEEVAGAEKHTWAALPCVSLGPMNGYLNPLPVLISCSTALGQICDLWWVPWSLSCVLTSFTSPSRAQLSCVLFLSNTSYCS